MYKKQVNIIREKIAGSITNYQALLADENMLFIIDDAFCSIISAIRSGNKLLICGNGGSAADAQHMAGEFLCRFYKDREPLPAIALTTDTSVITAISNDYDYDQVFARQIKALAERAMSFWVLVQVVAQKMSLRHLRPPVRWR